MKRAKRRRCPSKYSNIQRFFDASGSHTIEIIVGRNSSIPNAPYRPVDGETLMPVSREVVTFDGSRFRRG